MWYTPRILSYQLLVVKTVKLDFIIDGRAVHDLEKAAQYLELIVPGTLPFMGRPIFETLDMGAEEEAGVLGGG